MLYLAHILTLAGIYAILAMSLNLVAGYAGLLSIAHAAFYGIGAYTTALMALNLHTPFGLNLLCAIVVSVLVGLLLGMPALRVRDDYFAIATFGFQIITFSLFNNWVALTRGPMGLPDIPPPVIFGWTVSSPIDFLVLVAGFCLLVSWIMLRIDRAPLGRVLKALREDEIFATALGKNVVAQKLQVFVLGAVGAAVAGVLYAHYVSFIDPTSFTVSESIYLISLVVVGGTGNPWGGILGAIVLVVLPESLRFLGLPSALAANLHQVAYGSLLVTLMLWRPQGFMGDFSFNHRS